MNKLLLCLFLAGCSAGIQPSLDLSFADAANDASSSPDFPDLGVDADPPDLGEDAEFDASADAPSDAASDTGAPDLGPPACASTVDPAVTLCGDGRCCTGGCDHCVPVSGTLCTCFYTSCTGDVCMLGDMVCPCH